MSTHAYYETMRFTPERAKSCVCFLSKTDYLHHWKTGEDAFGKKWRVVCDDFGAVVYVEIKHTPRLHRLSHIGT